MKIEKRPLLLVIAMIMGLSCSCSTASAANPPATTAVAVEPQEQRETPAPPGATLASAETVIVDQRGKEDGDVGDAGRDDIHLPEKESREEIVKGQDEVPDDSIYGESDEEPEDEVHEEPDEVYEGPSIDDGIAPWVYEDSAHPGCHNIDIKGMLAFLWGVDEAMIAGSVREFHYDNKLVYFTDEKPGTTTFRSAGVEYEWSVGGGFAYEDDPRGEILGLGDSDGCIAESLAKSLYELIVESEQAVALAAARAGGR